MSRSSFESSPRSAGARFGITRSFAGSTSMGFPVMEETTSLLRAFF